MDQEDFGYITGDQPPQNPQGQKGTPACFVHDVTIKAEGVTVQALHEKLLQYCKRYVFQMERGDGGYLHYQGRVTLIKKRRVAEIAKIFNDDLFKAWFTPTSNNARDRESFYCMKADTRVDGPWKESDYQAPIVYTRQMREFMAFERYPWQVQVEKWCKEWDKRTIYWVYDRTGCNGKSDLVEFLHTTKVASVVPPMRNLEDIVQFCMSYPAKAYLIDFPRAMKKEALFEFYAALETLKNGYLYDKRYKGKCMFIDRPAVIIFSNSEPDDSSMSRDRWSVWELKGKKLEPLSAVAKASAVAAVAAAAAADSATMLAAWEEEIAATAAMP